MREFLRRYRTMIDEMIRAAGGTYFNDTERRLWVENDEGLYQLARSEGVKI